MSRPAPRTVVLVGAGHAHLHVAARTDELTALGARVVLVDPGQFWYSGRATGLLGGLYGPDADCLDTGALITARGGEFIADRAVAVDTAARRVRLAGGAELAYDYLSLNVGSRVDLAAIGGLAESAAVWPVKPIENLWRLRQALEQRFRTAQPTRVAVIGGGPTGCEIAANVRALGRLHGVDPSVTLIAPGSRLIEQAPAGAARKLYTALARRGVIVRLETRIATCREGSLVTEAGETVQTDVVILATGLCADPLVQTAGLPATVHDGLRVNGRLQSVADAAVFAAGDCAAMTGRDLPKLGVFGVRQAPVLHANLRAGLAGTSLAEYRPQKRWLAILNLGDGSGLATWGPFWWLGAASQRLKDRIDRRFLAGYRRLYRSST